MSLFKVYLSTLYSATNRTPVSRFFKRHRWLATQVQKLNFLVASAFQLRIFRSTPPSVSSPPTACTVSVVSAQSPTAFVKMRSKSCVTTTACLKSNSAMCWQTLVVPLATPVKCSCNFWNVAWIISCAALVLPALFGRLVNLLLTVT